MDYLFNHSTSSQARERLKDHLFIDDSGVDAIKAVLRSPDAEGGKHYEELTTIKFERLGAMREEQDKPLMRTNSLPALLL